MKQAWLQLRSAAQDLFFPASCLICHQRLPGNPTILFCRTCRSHLTLLSEPLCTMCGKPFLHGTGGNHFCSGCLQKPKHFRKARGIVLYTDEIKKLVHALKYHKSTVSLATFTALKTELLHLEDFADADLILPVPLHHRRLRQRGFNQALLLARYFFAEQPEKIHPDLLVRVMNTPPQTGLSGAARRRNLKRAFQVKNPEQISNKRVVLVDDVFTTGTTVNECARILRSHGARDVMVLTLARVAD